jgi:hypothetical protein
MRKPDAATMAAALARGSVHLRRQLRTLTDKLAHKEYTNKHNENARRRAQMDSGMLTRHNRGTVLLAAERGR